ncbi:MAG: hypothetical protein WA532_03970 [Candidatus Korobacteraceae bacterium]
MWKYLAIFALLFGYVPCNAAQSQKPSNPTTLIEADEHHSHTLQQDGPTVQPADEPKSVRIILPLKDNYDLWAF